MVVQKCWNHFWGWMYALCSNVIYTCRESTVPIVWMHTNCPLSDAQFSMLRDEPIARSKMSVYLAISSHDHRTIMIIMRIMKDDSTQKWYRVYVKRKKSRFSNHPWFFIPYTWTPLDCHNTRVSSNPIGGTDFVEWWHNRVRVKIIIQAHNYTGTPVYTFASLQSYRRSTNSIYVTSKIIWALGWKVGDLEHAQENHARCSITPFFTVENGMSVKTVTLPPFTPYWEPVSTDWRNGYRLADRLLPSYWVYEGLYCPVSSNV